MNSNSEVFVFRVDDSPHQEAGMENARQPISVSIRLTGTLPPNINILDIVSCACSSCCDSIIFYPAIHIFCDNTLI